MKNKFLTALTLAAFVLGFAGAASAQSRIGFKLGGGLAYVGGGDPNTGLQGWSDIYDYTLTMGGDIVSGGYSPVHLGMNFTGELLFQITPEMAIGLGGGYLSAKKTSEMPVIAGGTQHKISWDPSVT